MHPLRTCLHASLLVAFALLSSGCRAYPPGVPLPDIVDEVNATLEPKVVRLRPGDSVKVQFLNNPSLNQQAGVRPDGRANFALLEELDVEGMTVDALAELLTRMYEESLISPELSVSLAKVSQRQIHLLGREGRGRVNMGPRLRLGLIEFFAMARVPRQTTTPMQHLVLMRWMPEEQRRKVWVIDAREEYWYHPTRLMLQADDILYIPEQPIISAGQWMRTFLRLLPLPQFLLRQA